MVNWDMMDGGMVDGSMVDGGVVDGGMVDWGVVDRGVVDGSMVDGGMVTVVDSVSNSVDGRSMTMLDGSMAMLVGHGDSQKGGKCDKSLHVVVACLKLIQMIVTLKILRSFIVIV